MSDCHPPALNLPVASSLTQEKIHTRHHADLGSEWLSDLLSSLALCHCDPANTDNSHHRAFAHAIPLPGLSSSRNVCGPSLPVGLRLGGVCGTWESRCPSTQEQL